MNSSRLTRNKDFFFAQITFSWKGIIFGTMKMESSVGSSLPLHRSEGTWEIVPHLLPFIHCKVLTSILLVLPLSYKFLQQEASLCQPSVITEHRIDGWRPENNSSPLWRTKLQSIPLQLMDDRTFSTSEKSKKKVQKMEKR